MLATMAVMMAASVYEVRAQDWRNGAVVYQVFVDRFVPPTSLEAKRALYPSPATLREWSATPKATAYDPKIKGYPHVFEFWGGDLNGVRSKLDYVKTLGADVLYMLPIFRAPSNHKYDTEDYFAIDPQYGTDADFRGLLKDAHGRGMRVMLDGVFNHIGATSKVFREGPRDWFFYDPKYENGYRGWAGVASLPALRLETPGVRQYLWENKDSVVQSWLRKGIDGWRLDVAFELGPDLLKGITDAAHRTRRGSWVVGEISGYPSNWFPAVDGVFNFTLPKLGIEMAAGRMTGGQASRAVADLVADAGIENLLKSWLLVENHDTPRLATIVPDAADRRLVTVLQMTLPGAPCVYYGQELGLTGQGDPENRAPMRWDLATETNPDYSWTRKLLAIRKAQPALRVGDYTPLASNRLMAFARHTDKLKETVIVAINPTAETVRESFPTRVGRILSWGQLSDQLNGEKARSINGMLDLEMPPKSVRIFVPAMESNGGYSPYDRVG